MLRMRILASLFLVLAVPAMAAVPAKAYDRPLTFEANHGQFVRGVLYAARGPEYSVVIDSRGASLHLDDATLRLQLVGANAGSHIEAIDELPAKSAYFIGNDPAKWTRNIPNFSRVRQAGVWPGIKGLSTLQFSPGGGSDISVSKFAPDGQTLLFSIYFGSSGLDYPRGIATDPAGNVYVLGWAGSDDFPIVNAVQPTQAGGCGVDLFVSK